MKGIKCCAECAGYSLKKHKCTYGAKDPGKATDNFYADCPLVDAQPLRRGRWETIDPSFAHVYCSECGAAADKHLAKRYKGCPFCLCVLDATDTNVGGKGGADNG